MSEALLWPILIIVIGLISGGSYAIDCPAKCECEFRDYSNKLHANCSNRGFNEYPKIDNLSFNSLDLSGNNFREFPRHFSNMTGLLDLDLSNNYISKLDRDALKGFNSLETLNLGNNSITSWADIHANESFKHAPKLLRLYLSDNRLGSLGFSQDLIHESLYYLHISSAHISDVNFSNFKDQLPGLVDW